VGHLEYDAVGYVSAPSEQLLEVIGDIDGDTDVDLNDFNRLRADLNKAVLDSQCGTDCDLDGDGRITILDARQLVLLCSRSKCGRS